MIRWNYFKSIKKCKDQRSKENLSCMLLLITAFDVPIFVDLQIYFRRYHPPRHPSLRYCSYSGDGWNSGVFNTFWVIGGKKKNHHTRTWESYQGFCACTSPWKQWLSFAPLLTLLLFHMSVLELFSRMLSHSCSYIVSKSSDSTT